MKMCADWDFSLTEGDFIMEYTSVSDWANNSLRAKPFQWPKLHNQSSDQWIHSLWRRESRVSSTIKVGQSASDLAY